MQNKNMFFFCAETVKRPKIITVFDHVQQRCASLRVCLCVTSISHNLCRASERSRGRRWWGWDAPAVRSWRMTASIIRLPQFYGMCASPRWRYIAWNMEIMPTVTVKAPPPPHTHTHAFVKIQDRLYQLQSIVPLLVPLYKYPILF